MRNWSQHVGRFASAGMAGNFAQPRRASGRRCVAHAERRELRRSRRSIRSPTPLRRASRATSPATPLQRGHGRRWRRARQRPAGRRQHRQVPVVPRLSERPARSRLPAVSQSPGLPTRARGSPYQLVPVPQDHRRLLQHAGQRQPHERPGQLRHRRATATSTSTPNYIPRPIGEFACASNRAVKLTPWGENAPNSPFLDGGLSGQGFGVAFDPSSRLWIAQLRLPGSAVRVPAAERHEEQRVAVHPRRRGALRRRTGFHAGQHLVAAGRGRPIVRATCGSPTAATTPSRTYPQRRSRSSGEHPARSRHRPRAIRRSSPSAP